MSSKPTSPSPSPSPNSTSTSTPKPSNIRGTFMAVNGKRVYVETRSLEDCLINFQPDELPQQMRDRLQSVFANSMSTNINSNNKTYIPIVFDFDYENPHKTEEYKFAGFWNPYTRQYEFDNKQLVNLISKM